MSLAVGSAQYTHVQFLSPPLAGNRLLRPPCPTAGLVLPRNSVRCRRFHFGLGGGCAVDGDILRPVAQGWLAVHRFRTAAAQTGRDPPLGGPEGSPPSSFPSPFPSTPPFLHGLGAAVAIAPTHWPESPRERAHAAQLGAECSGSARGGRGAGTRRDGSSGPVAAPFSISAAGVGTEREAAGLGSGLGRWRSACSPRSSCRPPPR